MNRLSLVMNTSEDPDISRQLIIMAPEAVHVGTTPDAAAAFKVSVFIAAIPTERGLVQERLGWNQPEPLVAKVGPLQSSVPLAMKVNILDGKAIAENVNPRDISERTYTQTLLTPLSDGDEVSTLIVQDTEIGERAMMQLLSAMVQTPESELFRWIQNEPAIIELLQGQAISDYLSYLLVVDAVNIGGEQEITITIPEYDENDGVRNHTITIAIERDEPVTVEGR